jgi:hypothetical protein
MHGIDESPQQVQLAKVHHVPCPKAEGGRVLQARTVTNLRLWEFKSMGLVPTVVLFRLQLAATSPPLLYCSSLHTFLCLVVPRQGSRRHDRNLPPDTYLFYGSDRAHRLPYPDESYLMPTSRDRAAVLCDTYGAGDDWRVAGFFLSLSIPTTTCIVCTCFWLREKIAHNTIC